MPFEISIYPARHRVHILQERALYTAIAVASSVAITAAISLAIHGEIRNDFLLTAALCSFLVAVPMTALFQRLNRELHDALERERLLIIREEKQKTLRQTMFKVQHHVNNLANCLQLVELEYAMKNGLSAATLDCLQDEIRRTGLEMQALGRLDDPFDARAFEVRLE
jgi:hypothetical protein